MAADRAQHVAERDRSPRSTRGEWVVCDRYVPSSLVYQGVVRGLGVDVVEQLSAVATAGLEPDLVLVARRARCGRGRARAGDRARPARARRRARSTPRCGAAYRDLAAERGLGRGRRRRRRRRGGGARLATRSSRSWQDDGRGGDRASGPGSSGRTARWRCCSAPRRGRCTPTSSSARAAPASRRRRGASPPRSIAPDDDERAVGPRAARRPSRRGRDRSGGQPDPRRGRAGRSSTRRTRSPIEGERKVDRRCSTPSGSASTRPPPTSCSRRWRSRRRRAMIVLVTAGADQLLPTIRSRCQRVDFAYLGRRRGRRRARRRRHRRAGARRSARAPRGRSPRPRARARRSARRRARRVRRRRRRRSTAPAARSRRSRSSCRTRCRARSPSSRPRRPRRPASSSVELEAAGYPDRTRRAQLRRLEEHHKRAHRHARTDALLEGITALETVYRDALGGSPDERAQPRP